jgi:exonuclease VII large subunit
MWREQADYMRGELQRTTAALQQVLRQQQDASPAGVFTPGGKPGDLFNIDEKELANLHPAVQAMFRAMKELHENVGGIKTQFDQTTRATAVEKEAQQLRETETALNAYIDTSLENAQLPKGGTLTNMVSRVALQSLRNLHSQGYAITRSVIDSVVGDLVSSIKQDMAPKQPTTLPPQPKPGGGGNPQLPAVPTAADRKAALTAAISSFSTED